MCASAALAGTPTLPLPGGPGPNLGDGGLEFRPRPKHPGAGRPGPRRSQAGEQGQLRIRLWQAQVRAPVDRLRRADASLGAVGAVSVRSRPARTASSIARTPDRPDHGTLTGRSGTFTVGCSTRPARFDSGYPHVESPPEGGLLFLKQAAGRHRPRTPSCNGTQPDRPTRSRLERCRPTVV
jgi:hypothetical protein